MFKIKADFSLLASDPCETVSRSLVDLEAEEELRGGSKIGEVTSSVRFINLNGFFLKWKFGNEWFPYPLKWNNIYTTF